MASPVAQVQETPEASRGVARRLSLYTRSPGDAARDPFPRVNELDQDLRTLSNRFDAKGGYYVHVGHAVRSASSDHIGCPARFVATSVSGRRLYLDDHGLAADPTYRRALEAKTPFAWALRDPDWTEEPGSWLGRRLQVRAIQGGVVVPIQDYAAGPAYLCLHFAFADEAGQMIADRAGDLAAAAAAFHDRAKIRINCAKSGGAGNLLTPREMDCLRLAALGYTVTETAAALQVTPRTIEFHLKNATSKFEAPNKLRAVVLAVSRGLIAI